MNEEIQTKRTTKEWSIKLRVSPEEEKKIKMGAIQKGMGIATYIKQAALEKIPSCKPEIQGKLN